MLCFAIEAKGLEQGELLQGRRAAAFISTLAARGAQPLRQELGRNQRRGLLEEDGRVKGTTVTPCCPVYARCPLDRTGLVPGPS